MGSRVEWLRAAPSGQLALFTLCPQLPTYMLADLFSQSSVAQQWALGNLDMMRLLGLVVLRLFLLLLVLQLLLVLLRQLTST